jgi:copper chaperone CopZ
MARRLHGPDIDSWIPEITLMKRVCLLLVSLAVTTTWLGCQASKESTDTNTTDAAATTPDHSGSGEAVAETSSGDTLLVSLKVPNMLCDGCASAIREDLEKIDGVTQIETDPANHACRFKVTTPGVDIQAKLAELATTNVHLAGYEIQ